MLLAIDIGNSSINIGFFEGRRLIVHKIDSYPLKSSSFYFSLFKRFLREKNIDKTPSACIISSVIPKHTHALKEAGKLTSGKKPLVVSPEVVSWIDFTSYKKEELGADRVCSSAGAVELYGTPLVVVDFGTATTLNFIAEGNVFKGGAILPGIGLMADALKKGTSKLPRAPLKRPKSVLGRDAIGSMLSGIILGSSGAVERLISDVEKTEAKKYQVILTGGYSGLVSAFLKRIDFIEPNLVLKGMRFIYKKQCEN
ncbi:MAG: type III pantothenate kinase [Nitrospirae bacterium]|nr:type III pantothenate kinase [Nitrospirota bacterium]